MPDQEFINPGVKPGYVQPELNFKTAFNADGFELDNEVNLLPSLTVPGQSMTVREIMTRHASGLMPLGVKVPVWDDEDAGFIPDPQNMDLVERQEFEIAAREELVDLAEKRKPVEIKVGKPDIEEAQVVPDAPASTS